jgi:pimeloyl-ACP methyl ester carboxylesterase
LIHGGIEMFGPTIPILAQDHRVIAVDLQGHGRTKDIDRTLRDEHMGDEIAALVGHLGIRAVDVIDYSLGGGVALHMAIRHPQVVRRLVVIGRAIKHGGYYPEIAEAFDKVGPHIAANMKRSPLYTMYPDVDWPTLFTKTAEMERRDYDWSADVASISAPMWMFANADMITRGHLLEIWASSAAVSASRTRRLEEATRPPRHRTWYNSLRHPRNHRRRRSGPTVPGWLRSADAGGRQSARTNTRVAATAGYSDTMPSREEAA